MCLRAKKSIELKPRVPLPPSSRHGSEPPKPKRKRQTSPSRSKAWSDTIKNILLVDGNTRNDNIGNNDYPVAKKPTAERAMPHVPAHWAGRNICMYIYNRSKHTQPARNVVSKHLSFRVKKNMLLWSNKAHPDRKLASSSALSDDRLAADVGEGTAPAPPVRLAR